MKVELNSLPARLRLPLMDMLQSMVGREMQGRALDSGIPGQVVRLHLGGQTIRALLQGRGVQEGQNLFFRIEKEGGQFFLKLLGKAEMDSAADNPALREFIMRLGTEKLQFFHSLTDLFKYWKHRSQSKESSETGLKEADAEGRALTGETGEKVTGAIQENGDSREFTALASMKDSPAFWAMTAAMPGETHSLFVFYADSPEFNAIRLLVVQPEDSAREQLSEWLAGYQEPTIQSITVLSRFPDPSFFQVGQLWEA
ncbi:MAG TPA: hypothetical protein DEA96_14135 [Leptospiraceae bacterium]|nr:hypothetical protein [Spirochaetaceae bacterium]HBS06102.1 hypothetical protein [Leptospiraceae bacterium]|tara:strand:- start:27033 stop:27800 length:768 start_codon:yes stop_codon:yes gene_type:complete